MKIINLKKFTNPFQWGLFISYDVVFKNRTISKLYERSVSTCYEVVLMTLEVKKHE